LHHSPPAGVAGVARLAGRQQLPPHRRADAIGRHQGVGGSLRTVFEEGRDVGGSLLEAGQPVPELHHAGRQRPQQHALQVGPQDAHIVVAQPRCEARGVGLV
jgi:hypothetical protein